MVIRDLSISRYKQYYVVFSFCCKTNYSKFQFLGNPEGVKNNFFSCDLYGVKIPKYNYEFYDKKAGLLAES